MSYLNRRQIEGLALVTLAVSAVEDLEKDQRFKGSMADLRRGRTFILKGVRAISETMEESDKKKFVRLPESTKILLVPTTSPQKDETIVKSEALINLTEFAIGRECVGCNRKDWRSCRLRDALIDTWTPAANETKNDCQYKQ